jgi:MFS family permease
MPSPWLSLLFLVPATVGGGIPSTIAVASLMQISPNEMRAKASALYYFVVSMVGLGLGPTSVALITDYYFRDEARLQHSLAIVATVAGLAAVAVLLWVRPWFRASVAAARAWNGEPPRA